MSEVLKANTSVPMAEDAITEKHLAPVATTYALQEAKATRAFVTTTGLCLAYLGLVSQYTALGALTADEAKMLRASLISLNELNTSVAFASFMKDEFDGEEFDENMPEPTNEGTKTKQ